MKKQKGFSIVEILVLAAVLALLGTIGWLVYSSNANKTETTGSADSEMTNKNPLIEKRGNVTVLRAVAGPEDLKVFIAEEFKDICSGQAPNNPQVSIVSLDEESALLRRGCVDPGTFVFAQKSDGRWRLLEDSYQKFLGGIPYCEIVDKYSISTEVVTNCLEKSPQSDQYVVRGKVAASPEQ